jgi:hypothetical protein
MRRVNEEIYSTVLMTLYTLATEYGVRVRSTDAFTRRFVFRRGGDEILGRNGSDDLRDESYGIAFALHSILLCGPG